MYLNKVRLFVCLPSFWKRLNCLALFLWLASSFSYSYEVVDSFGKHEFQSPPERVVVTDWTLLEQLLELGVVPVGAPELEAYEVYVGQPELPEGIVDIGQRRAPSMQVIESLAPDLIILGTDQKEFDRLFSRISRVGYYQNFSHRWDSNGEKAQQRLQQLATLFQREEIAEQKLEQLHLNLDQARSHLSALFGELPLVTLARITPNGSALVYGEHSLPGYSLQQLGLSSEIEVPKNKFGELQMSISDLAQVEQGYLLFWLDPLQKDMVETEEWTTLPSVQNKRAIELSPAWSYGGAMSLMYITQAIVNALAMPGS